MRRRRARTEHFNMWLTEEEWYLLEEAARATGSNMSAFIRSAAMREVRTVLAGTAEVVEAKVPRRRKAA